MRSNLGCSVRDASTRTVMLKLDHEAYARFKILELGSGGVLTGPCEYIQPTSARTLLTACKY